MGNRKSSGINDMNHNLIQFKKYVITKNNINLKRLK